ncbi:energy transducer TonB [Hephaestia mangrovi]|uniref:energy transducer TonB n=1 Tax=Hephaestia mangrovi TaxID=2873268 RepID=UPI001CA79685|nr:energy transducer TonB [Hephaestia mangrovi]MBY8827844.1 energy transducer TonB [Hephaestia mangrovi]
MIVVRAACGVLIVAILFLAGLAVQGRVERFIDERRVLQALAAEAPGKIANAAGLMPKPLGSPGAWFDPDSYPPTALRAGEEGSVRVKVAVDSDGVPIRCRVVQSSGYADLDQGTCDIVMRRGRFVPATDAAGHAIPAISDSFRIRWQLTS